MVYTNDIKDNINIDLQQRDIIFKKVQKKIKEKKAEQKYKETEII